MSTFLTKWAVLSLALAATAWLLPGVHVHSVGALLGAAIALGFLNAVLKPLLVLLTLPLTIVTLGIFYFVLNAILFALGSVLVPGFTVDGFGWAFLGALLMGALSTVLSSLLGPGDESRGLRIDD
ncbi:phage holin family protein [bacterium]|nr:phage holin family protein [bacterium]